MSIKHKVIKLLYEKPHTQSQLAYLCSTTEDEIAKVLHELSNSGQLFTNNIEDETVWCSINWFIKEHKTQLLKWTRKIIHTKSFDLLEEGYSWALFTIFYSLKKYNCKRSNKLLAFLHKGVTRWVNRHTKKYLCSRTTEQVVDDFELICNLCGETETMDHDQIDNNEFVEYIFRLLNENERKIIRYVCWENKTFREIAQEVGYSREWVRNVYNNAISKIRKYCFTEGLLQER